MIAGIVGASGARPRIAALAGVVLVSFVAGCSSQMDIQVVGRPDIGPFPARSANCTIRIYNQADTLPEACLEIGDVYVGDTGASINCGLASVRDRAHDQACRYGADALQIIRHQTPSGGSSCHQIRARLLRCADTAAAEGEKG
jgi:hypothetical protein